MPARDGVAGGAGFRPIGVFRTDVESKAAAPRQSGLGPPREGRIEIESDYAEGLADLEGFDRLWVLSWLDRAIGWKARVRPPRADARKGLFATRSPHRPNPIGLSCVELVRVEPPIVIVRGHDLLDRTPILDLKPYLPYADAFPTARAGWVDGVERCDYAVEWTVEARARAEWLVSHGVDAIGAVETILAVRPHPRVGHRVRDVGRDGAWHLCILALRTWRYAFRRDDQTLSVVVDRVFGGYREAVLRGEEPSRWDDVPLHREFGRRFERGCEESPTGGVGPGPGL
ncbi:MAG: tRNA (N6-threonylcarbamoyladenosine(37)-N6)-methyltransferase TrmO [Planctomycetes bacterium]|nr:tRNA (N6-threonylcarbamoyladenosine(37)-N6)-methyltransferase TrmO [Planctomycetota bacterium]